MDVSPDGRRIAAVSAAPVKQWDAQSGEDVGPTMAGHDSATEHVDFSPDGRYLASVGKNDTLRFWDPASGRQVGEPVDITMVGDIAFIEFSGDGRRVFLAAKNMPTDGGSSSVGGGIWQVPAPAAWADALCEKLTTNPNQEQWNEWISSDPEIARAALCPGAPIAPSEP